MSCKRNGIKVVMYLRKVSIVVNVEIYFYEVCFYFVVVL